MKNLIKRLRMYRATPYQRAEIVRKEGEVRIGKNCRIFHGVNFGSEPYLITIGDEVTISSGVRFVTHDGGVHVLRNLYDMPEADIIGTITVGNNVFIGMNSIILSNKIIGNNVIIGAGSVVAKDIPDNTVACGVPAKVIKTVEEYYRTNQLKMTPTKKMSSKEKKEYLLHRYE